MYCHKYSGGEGKSKNVTPYGCTKNDNDFQIIFAHHIFLSSNTGLWPKEDFFSSGFGGRLLQCQFKVLSNC